MNIGILGGTFDPVHNGHIMMAKEAKKRLDLAEVLFIPTARTPLKEGTDITSVEHRIQMVLLAIEGYDYFRLSRIEIDRGGTSYTVDTLAALEQEYGAGYEFFYIIGLDSLGTLPGWKQPERLIKMCRLVAVARPDYSLPDLDVIEKSLPGISKRLIYLDKPEVDISATEIRRMVAEGLPVDHLVPGPVAEYIRKHGLYKKSAE